MIGCYALRQFIRELALGTTELEVQQTRDQNLSFYQPKRFKQSSPA